MVKRKNVKVDETINQKSKIPVDMDEDDHPTVEQ